MESEPTQEIIELRKTETARVYRVEGNPESLVIEATSTYIPIEQFKTLFLSMENLVRDKGVKKIIFDKRALRVFHQPSMEWYFVEWKEKMAAIGVTEHVKILPDDEVFCQSVLLGRQAIDREYPNAEYHKLSIKYADSIQEALDLEP